MIGGFYNLPLQNYSEEEQSYWMIEDDFRKISEGVFFTLTLIINLYCYSFSFLIVFLLVGNFQGIYLT